GATPATVAFDPVTELARSRMGRAPLVTRTTSVSEEDE
ncbi:MAG: hypothetical protein JWP68_663, partial [Modestobacter sp.]|nr:hypothetical protein [Modestobacter sp.]MCW2507515.1 hypothetical protein [Modestobacter sp.]